MQEAMLVRASHSTFAPQNASFSSSVPLCFPKTTSPDGTLPCEECASDVKSNMELLSTRMRRQIWCTRPQLSFSITADALIGWNSYLRSASQVRGWSIGQGCGTSCRIKGFLERLTESAMISLSNGSSPICGSTKGPGKRRG